MNFLSDIRNAAIANAVIVVFHIYIAFAVEGVGFLVIVLSICVLIAPAYFITGSGQGKIGAVLLALPTLAYLLVVPDIIEASTTSGGDDGVGWVMYILAPFWLFTILLNIMSTVAEIRGTSKYAKG